MRTILKSILLSTCNGFARLMGKSVAPAILMYHSFDETDWKHGVAPAELAKQLEWLVANRTVVSLADMAAYVRGERTVPNNAVAITIDDGYADTHDIFFPLAKKYQLPFTLFLTTDLAAHEKLGNLKRPTEAQLTEMHDSGLMTLGLHGHSHVNFPDVLREGTADEEIIQSKQYLEDTFGSSVTAVAYPAGRVTEEVFSYVADLGLTIGCTTRPGFVVVGRDPLRLPRIHVDRTTRFSLFTGRLQPGFAVYLNIVRFI